MDQGASNAEPGSWELHLAWQGSGSSLTALQSKSQGSSLVVKLMTRLALFPNNPFFPRHVRMLKLLFTDRK